MNAMNNLSEVIDYISVVGNMPCTSSNTAMATPASSRTIILTTEKHNLLKRTSQLPLTFIVLAFPTADTLMIRTSSKLSL